MDNKNLFQEFREKFDLKDFLRILEIASRSMNDAEIFEMMGNLLDLNDNEMQDLRDRLNEYMDEKD